MSLKFIAKIDLSNSKVDSKFYLDRTQILSLDTLSDAEKFKVSNFINCGLELRTLVGAFNGRGYSAFPDKSYYLNNVDTGAEEYEDNGVVAETVYSIVQSIHNEFDWTYITESSEFKNFRSAADEMQTVLGWSIGEFVKVESDVEEDLTFEIAQDLWNSAQ